MQRCSHNNDNRLHKTRKNLRLTITFKSVEKPILLSFHLDPSLVIPKGVALKLYTRRDK